LTFALGAFFFELQANLLTIDLVTKWTLIKGLERALAEVKRVADLSAEL